MDKARIIGMTVDNMWASGVITICMGGECTHGKTVESTKVIIRMIESMGLELILGRTAVNTRDSGRTVSNMVKGSTDTVMGRRSGGSGSMGNGLSGLIIHPKLCENNTYL